VKGEERERSTMNVKGEERERSTMNVKGEERERLRDHQTVPAQPSVAAVVRSLRST
jgi:hypothetical protein